MSELRCLLRPFQYHTFYLSQGLRVLFSQSYLSKQYNFEKLAPRTQTIEQCVALAAIIILVSQMYRAAI